MEARSEPALPEGDGWWFEPKWDGFRCLAFRQRNEVRLQAKSGKPLGRYFPEVVDVLRELTADPFILDGELLVQCGGRFSFEALQMRLHPSETRIQRLASETPASPDAVRHAALADERRSLRLAAERAPVCAGDLRQGLQGQLGFVCDARHGGSALAKAWLDDGRLEGVVAKRRDGRYLEGE
jgi:ATP-dependent DNA ligase